MSRGSSPRILTVLDDLGLYPGSPDSNGGGQVWVGTVEGSDGSRDGTGVSGVPTVKVDPPTEIRGESPILPLRLDPDHSTGRRPPRPGVGSRPCPRACVPEVLHRGGAYELTYTHK